MGIVVNTERHIAFDGRICGSKEEAEAHEASILYDRILEDFGNDVFGADPPEHLSQGQKAAWIAQKTRTMRDGGMFISWADDKGMFAPGAVPSRDDPALRNEEAIAKAIEAIQHGVVRRRNTKRTAEAT